MLHSQLILWKTENPDTPGLQVQLISHKVSTLSLENPNVQEARAELLVIIRDIAASKQIPSADQALLCKALFRHVQDGTALLQRTQQTWEM